LASSKKKKKTSEGAVKILCVTHGGLIMEFMNFVDSLQPAGSSGSRPNKAKNCSINIFHIKENKTMPLGFTIETIVENEVSHLAGGGEDRLLGKGNA
jgi:broad specificity phosphatase PhoE